MTAGELDRRALARSLAQVHAFRDCGQEANARAAAWTLAQELRAAGLLPDRLDVDQPALEAIETHRLSSRRVLACMVCGRGFDPGDPQPHAIETGHQPDVVRPMYPGARS